MLAGLVTGPRQFELVEVPEPTVAPGLAVVAINRCGICGTDLHGFLAGPPYNPAICGHEWSGTVVAAHADVANVTEGDRVVMATPPPCGSCPECHARRPTMCRSAFLSMVGRDAMAPAHGGFAARLALNAARLVKVPASLHDDAAAIVEPTTIGLHAVRRTMPHAGETVVVQGCGPIGLLTMQCARALGADHIVAVEPHAHRRALAVATGADVALTPDEAAQRFRSEPADLVFECAGVAPTVQSAVDLVRRGGRVNLVGLASGAATIQPGSWLTKEVTVVASVGAVHAEAIEAIELIADGHVDVNALHDRTVSLAELPHAMEVLADDPSSAVKVLVDPTG